METETKEKVNWQRLAITTGIVLLTALAVGGTTWYVMDKNAKDEKAANEKSITELQEQINELKKDENKSTETTEKTPTITELTNEQIFQEVATKFGFSKSEVAYFRIFGQDKVQYSINTGTNSGTIFAYKVDGKWNKLVSGTGVPGCSAFSTVPSEYIPPCIEGGKVVNVNTSNQSTNYPPLSMTSYIGE